MEQVENNLRLAFELDPGNYTAYDVYFYFLTNEVNQTEFASMAGAQLKDDDDASASGDASKPDDQGQSAAAEPQKGAQAQAAAAPTDKPGEQAIAFHRFTEQEQERRHTRAIEITEEAIRKFRPDTMDPERFLSAAVMWYNRIMLVAPDTETRQKSAAVRKEFERVGTPALSKMTYYLDTASASQRDLQQKGLWQALPERRGEFTRLMQLLRKCAFTLSVTLKNNRAQMAQDRQGPSAWGPLGQN